MTSSVASRTIHIGLRRTCELLGPRSSVLSALWSTATPSGRSTRCSKQHIHTTPVIRAHKKAEDGESPESRLDGLQIEGSGLHRTGSPPKPRVSMTESDKPDMMDLVDLIMSGTSYKDAVKGTEFDCLDKETEEEMEESIRRLKAQRENRLEEYLESIGDFEMLNKVLDLKGKPKESKKIAPPSPPKKSKTVEMAQGKWAEVLVHSDRVTKTVKGGMEVQYRALVTVGNLHGVGGFAIGKAANPAEAITEASRKAKLIPNLIYVERYKQASLCHDVVGKHNASKVYIWARPPGHGMRAGKLSRDILYNMGITDGACKIIGRRNKYSMIYALFDALAKHRGLETIARGRGKRILSLQREMAGRFA